ncbi:MAG: dihydropteroate synthase [Acidobacteriota bacterium]|nr:dihydropteroate synthase [Blastocatellia bacterium]MDW8411461.1 dihydropteroate synthase [Acidobacteriota bacterium]
MTAYLWKTRSRILQLGRRTLVMGVLNVTPDSFSDGGLYFSFQRAVDRALQIEDEGADILDIGGESTRPGAEPVTVEEELARVLPVIEAVVNRLSIPISVDTTKATVAQAALDAGAEIINDVSAMEFDPEMRKVVAMKQSGVCLMHTRGRPQVMQNLPPSSNIWREVIDGLTQAVNKALQAGLGREHICVDPGIGFGKTVEDNLEILRRLSMLKQLDLPILIGTSRKSFIGRVLGRSESERLLGTAATVTAAILHGAHIVRVHDVAEMVQVVRMTDAIAYSLSDLIA